MAYLHVLSPIFGKVTSWGAVNADLSAEMGFSAVAAGNAHSVGLRIDGTVRCWGGNSHGQSTVPPGLREVIAVAGGDNHTLALLRNGSIVGWGHNFNGQTAVPSGVEPAIGIAAGVSFSAAIRADGSVSTWGNAAGGVLDVPPDATNVISIAAGFAQVIALRQDGSVVAWGGMTEEDRIAMNSLTGVAAIAAGHANSAIVFSNGTAQIFGMMEEPSFPVSDASSAAIDYFHGILLLRDRTVASWGLNDFGQSAPPANLSNVVMVAAGSRHSIALVEAPCFIAPTVVNEVTFLGSNVVLRATVKAVYPVHLQWLRDGFPVTGATNAMLSLSNVGFGDGGRYTLQASNRFGLVVGPEIVLTVHPIAAAVIVQPMSASFLAGQTGLVAATAAGLGPSSYQ